MSSTKFVFFGPIGKTRWPHWPLIGWDIFNFSSETTEQNSTKLDREQDLNVFYQVCVFHWLRHFQLLLCNRWIEFILTWQEARSQRPLPSFCFSGRSEKQDGRPGLWLGWDIFDFSSETAEWNSTKLDRKQDLNVIYQVCVFCLIGKTRWPPWPLIGRDNFDSSETGWMEFNQTWQEARSQHPLPILCFFGPIRKTRWPPWPLIGWDIFVFSAPAL